MTHKTLLIKVSPEYVPEDGTVFDVVFEILDQHEIPANIYEFNPNANLYPVVRTDGETDVIIFSDKDEARRFTEKHPEYSEQLTSAVYDTAEEAFAIWGDDANNEVRP